MEGCPTEREDLKILFISPPQLELREPSAYISLGLAYLAAVLDGYDVEILDLSDQGSYSIPEADVYGITVTSAQLEQVRELCSKISEDSYTVLGGPHVTVSPDLEGDILVRGEGETIIRDIISNPDSYRGVVDAGIVKDLDSLPFPRRDLFPEDHVVNVTGIHGCEKGVRATTVSTSRGCPFNCAFCTKGHPMFNVPRLRSAPNVLEEIRSVQREYGIEHVRFIDDVFTLDPTRSVKIAEGLRNLGVTFIAITRADLVSKSLLQSFKLNGCTQIDLGVETASPRLLSLIDKRVTVELLEKVINICHEVGIKVKVFLQMGLPTETEEDRQLTLKFLERTRPDSFTLSKFRLLPGSRFASDPHLRTMFVNENLWFYPDSDPEYSRFRDEIRRIIP